MKIKTIGAIACGIFIAFAIYFSQARVPTAKPTPTTAPEFRIVARCMDGKRTDSTDKNACDARGGIKEWYYSR